MKHHHKLVVLTCHFLSRPNLMTKFWYFSVSSFWDPEYEKKKWVCGFLFTNVQVVLLMLQTNLRDWPGTQRLSPELQLESNMVNWPMGYETESIYTIPVLVTSGLPQVFNKLGQEQITLMCRCDKGRHVPGCRRECIKLSTFSFGAWILSVAPYLLCRWVYSFLSTTPYLCLY